MIEQNAFDTICHEHLEYYSVTDINNLCNYAGLELFDVSFNTVNGGSFRFFVQHVGGRNKITERLIETLSAEKMRDKILELELMFDRVQYLRNLTNKFLLECRDSGREVHGYGASTKGNTLLQYFGITRKEISCVAEINEKKFGKFK